MNLRFLVTRLWRWFPILVIMIDIKCSYYVYILQFCYNSASGIEGVFYGFMFHIMYIIFLWSLYWTVFSTHCAIPDSFKLTEEQIEALEKLEGQEKRALLEVYAKKIEADCYNQNGSVRFCKQCGHFKPSVARHCVTCEKCIMHSGHHCAFLNNCISVANYRYYTCFLGVSCLLCIFVFGTTLPYSVDFWKDGVGGPDMYYVVSLTIVAGLFILALLPMFAYNTLLSFIKIVYRSRCTKKDEEMCHPQGRYNVVREDHLPEYPL